MQKFSFQCKKESTTDFCFDEQTGIELRQLFDIPCVTNSSVAWVKGIVSIFTERGTFLSENNGIWQIDKIDNGFSVACTDHNTGLEHRSVWSFCINTGVWSRKDCLSNVSDKTVEVFRCLCRFPLSAGEYEVYSQGGSWCHESDGKWQKLSHGSIQLSCEGGRTTQGATPYLCIKETLHNHGAVFNIVPNGNWVIKVFARTAPGESLPFAIVELGLSDEYLRKGLLPGQQLELPEILIQELFSGQSHNSAPRLHEYLLKRSSIRSDFQIPLVYNTWFDMFDNLNTDRLEQQLAAAKNVGCEVFTVDAGWYGAQEGDWYSQTGDWREKRDGAFCSNMLAFSDKVRAAGLGFGLWMEPERFCQNIPVVKQHPEWFLDPGNGCYYIDLRITDAYNYIKSEILRLIDTYKLVWMKLDFNFSLGVDPCKMEFIWYYNLWYKLIEEIRQTHPGLFLEACASGGMRLELSSQSHCDACFLSDTVYPLDVLRIYEASILRLLPGRLTKWAVMRSAGNSLPVYGKAVEDSTDNVLTPKGATWESAESADIDFIVFSGMCGVLGLSGDLAGLSEKSIRRIEKLLAFYKKFRRHIYDCTAYLLTPMTLQGQAMRWQVVQMHCENQCEILFAYRLADMLDQYNVKPSELSESEQYRVEYWDKEGIYQEISGRELMDIGITIKIPERNHATAVVITKIQ